jgi:serine/threonine protein kinase
MPLQSRFTLSQQHLLVASAFTRETRTVGDLHCHSRSFDVCMLVARSFLASIRHPNIVGFLEAFLDDRKMELNIVMEYADGGDLANVIDKHRKARKNVDEGTIWAILLQLLDGLSALHERRIVHRGTVACLLCLPPSLPSTPALTTGAVLPQTSRPQTAS